MIATATTNAKNAMMKKDFTGMKQLGQAVWEIVVNALMVLLFCQKIVFFTPDQKKVHRMGDLMSILHSCKQPWERRRWWCFTQGISSDLFTRGEEETVIWEDSVVRVEPGVEHALGLDQKLDVRQNFIHCERHKRQRGWVLSLLLGHDTRSFTYLDQTLVSESRPTFSFRISTKLQLQNRHQISVSKS